MKLVTKLIVSVGLLLYAISLLDVNVMIGTLRQGSFFTLSFAVIINAFAFFVMALRWNAIISNSLRSSFRYQLALYFKATFFNTFTPANLGGDTYRLLMLKGGQSSTGELIRLLLRERIMGLYGYIIVFATAYTLIAILQDGGVLSVGNPYLYGQAIALIMLAFPLIYRSVGGRLTELVRALIGKDRLRGLEGWVGVFGGLLSLRGSLWPMVFTLVGIMLWVLSIQIIVSALGLTMPTLHIAAVATLVELIRLVPITAQGIGLREGAFSYLLSFLGHNADQCYAIGLMSYFCLSVSIVLCGPIGQILMYWYEMKAKR